MYETTNKQFIFFSSLHSFIRFVLFRSKSNHVALLLSTTIWWYIESTDLLAIHKFLWPIYSSNITLYIQFTHKTFIYTRATGKINTPEWVEEKKGTSFAVFEIKNWKIVFDRRIFIWKRQLLLFGNIYLYVAHMWRECFATYKS